jgi:excisionase family DNA binding protein
MDFSVKENDSVLTLKEAADYLRLSEMTILRLANQGLIPGAKIGRQWRFAKESIMALVKHPEILRRLDLRR